MTRRLDRRQALGVLGSVSLGGILAACGSGGDDSEPRAASTTDGGTATVEPKTPTDRATAELFEGSASCRLSPEQAEGPYYFDVDAIRSDIREDREGTPLRLALRVRDGGTCEPIENAVVDVWHCDAGGAYSGVNGVEGVFLRGTQVTDREGIADFTTVYPGWYPGRTVHVHAKVLLGGAAALTTQFFFDDAVTERVAADAPYAQAAGRDVFNDGDGIYEPDLELTLSEEDEGWLGLITVDVRR